MVTIRGERILLRPFRADELAPWLDARLAGADDRTVYPTGPPEPGLFFLSIALSYEDERGHGLGTDAARLLCDWLFASAGAERIESSTAVGDFDWARYSLVKGQEAAH